MERTKRCPKCGFELALAAFAFRDATRTKLQSYCRECQNEAWREWYSVAENRDSHLALVSRRRKGRIARHRALIKAAKAVPCGDCGVSYPYYVMDFDHVQEKQADVSRLIYLKGTEALIREVSRCEVVCANCHRERTHRRGLLSSEGE
jgi:hypothetical protein